MIAIRAASPSDSADIRSVHLRAFPSSSEADLVERLERDGDAVISLVASDGGLVIGHILFSRMRVKAEGRPFDALGLAPVAVIPERQSEGIGSALIEQGLSAAQSLGAEMIFVVGEPEYYGRFGFSSDMARPFRSPYAGPYFQAVALAAEINVLSSGSAGYAAAFAELE